MKVLWLALFGLAANCYSTLKEEVENAFLWMDKDGNGFVTRD